MNKLEILDAFMFRHACKEFDANRVIPAEDFDFILEIARLSPSSFGLEPWKFLVIQNLELREKLLEFTWGAKKQYPTASHVVICLVRKGYFMRYDSEYLRDFMARVQAFPEETIKIRSQVIEKFQKTDFSLLDTEEALTDWAAKQAYIPLANMMTAAAMIGIDSCPIEGFEKKNVEDLLARETGLETDKFGVAYSVAFGYRKADPERAKTRQQKEDIISWYL